MRVDFVIAGAQKCGTTALHSFLSQHPSIIGSNPKEIDFFNYEARYNKGLGYYHSNFKKPTLLESFFKKRFLEASATYISDCNISLTAERIKKYNENVRILCLVRNPTERAYSAWNMYRNRFYTRDRDWWLQWKKKRTGIFPDVVRRGQEEYENFERFLLHEIACLKEKKTIECEVLEIGNYHKGIEIFQEIFKSNFLVVQNEKLLSNTPAQLDEITQFLHIKRHNWTSFKNVKVFEGHYEKEIDKRSKELLNRFYSEANDKLWKLTDINYNY